MGRVSQANLTSLSQEQSQHNKKFLKEKGVGFNVYSFFYCTQTIIKAVIVSLIILIA
jgi:hypothetical protein